MRGVAGSFSGDVLPVQKFLYVAGSASVPWPASLTPPSTPWVRTSQLLPVRGEPVGVRVPIALRHAALVLALHGNLQATLLALQGALRVPSPPPPSTPPPSRQLPPSIYRARATEPIAKGEVGEELPMSGCPSPAPPFGRPSMPGPRLFLSLSLSLHLSRRSQFDISQASIAVDQCT